MRAPFLPAEKIQNLLQIEPALALLGLALSSWALYKFLLKEVSQERHRNLSRHFNNLAGHSMLFGGIFVLYQLIGQLPPESRLVQFLAPYLGLIAMLTGAVVFIKTLRVMILEYLFLGHMKVGVPLLLVNLFTLLASIVVGAWMLTEIFGLKIAPLLATSAIFSIVLGLAMQDTLGNLFAGVALQIDKPYEIGHWVEVQNGMQKWVGQVYEISWRATVLIGLSDETMTIPNRIMAQAQVSNFSIRSEPFARSQLFKIAHGSDLSLAKTTLLNACAKIPEVLKTPAPLVFCSDSQESGITLKVIYALQDYGAQFRVQDLVLSLGLAHLQTAGIPVALHRHEIRTVQNATLHS